MDKTPQRVVVKNTDFPTPRLHYEATTQDVLRALWRRKWMLVVTIAASLATAIAVLVYMGPSYTGEAIIQLDFGQEGAAHGTTGVLIEAAALVDSAARIIRSRATAEGVVARLELAQDPRFQHPSLKSRALSAFRSVLGFREVTSTPHDLAVNAVMRQVRVSSDPRSYVISVSATSNRPDDAAALANAVASDYLWRHTLQTMAEALAGAEREMAQVALIYGVRHPTYVRARSHVEELRSRFAAVRERAADADFGALQSLIPAREVDTPSSPNVPVMMAAALAFAIAVSTWLAWISVRSAGNEHRN
jgi:uncharacterized protein involved in exopolysaccharide biosynthesis